MIGPEWRGFSGEMKRPNMAFFLTHSRIECFDDDIKGMLFTVDHHLGVIAYVDLGIQMNSVLTQPLSQLLWCGSNPLLWQHHLAF